MNAIKFLESEHKKMKTLMKKASKASDAKTRKQLFETIKKEAKTHEQMEEKFLYPKLRESKKTRKDALEHTEEVTVMEFILTQLSKTPINSEEWSAKFQVLMELNNHHIEEEEEEVFPKAQKMLSDEELDEIGNKMVAFKESKA